MHEIMDEVNWTAPGYASSCQVGAVTVTLAWRVPSGHSIMPCSIRIDDSSWNALDLLAGRPYGRIRAKSTSELWSLGTAHIIHPGRQHGELIDLPQPESPQGSLALRRPTEDQPEDSKGDSQPLAGQLRAGSVLTPHPAARRLPAETVPGTNQIQRIVMARQLLK
jgi:hypothetical protein